MGMTAAHLEATMAESELVEHFAEMTLENREAADAQEKAAAKAKTRQAQAQPRRR